MNEIYRIDALRERLIAKLDTDCRAELVEVVELLADLALIVRDLQRKLEDK